MKKRVASENRALVFLPETDMYTDPFIRLKRG